MTGCFPAGLWGTAIDDNGDIAAYPIIEFDGTRGVDGGVFRGWDSNAPGQYFDLGLPQGFAFDSWYTLNISLSGGLFHYSVGLQGQALQELGSIDALGATSIQNVILQGHNKTSGVNTLIRWDNLSAAVPEPGAWALMIVGFGGAGVALRRRRAAAIAA